MNANQHTSNNLYKSNIQRYSVALYILNLLCFGCLTSIFLYGAYSMFNPDTAYLIGISVLVLISLLNKKFIQKPYWYLRSKINQALFSNLFSLSNLLFSLLTLILIYFYYQEGFYTIEFGLLGSVIFILGLPLSYYIWFTFSQTNEKGIIQIISSSSFNNFKSYEFYLLLIFIALFGLVYDFLPQSIEVLLFTPIALLAIFSLSIIVINKAIHKLLPHYLESFRSEETNINVKVDSIGSYEKKPYQLISLFGDDFFNMAFQEQKYLLYTIKRISAIDALDKLDKLIQNGNKSDPIFSILVEINEYLLKVNQKLKKIENPYEFIEQSNDLVLLKGLIRKQIKNSDKNLIIKLLKDNRFSVNKPACIIAGYYNDINIISTLIEHLEKPELNHWSQLALKEIGEKSIKYLEIEFSKRKENLLFVESCLSLICHIKSNNGYSLLFNALNETDSNIRKIAAKKIIVHKINVSEDHRKYFKNLFDDLILTLLSNGYLIKQLELKNEGFKSLKNAIDNENKESLYLIVNIIKLYYNKAATERIFKNYGKNSIQSHAASNALIDLMIDDNFSVRNKLKVLFSPNEKFLLESLQEEFPTINLNPKFIYEEDLIWIILKKEYDQINSWTRTCALNILQYAFKEDIPFELASEFLNKNQLLKETAAANIYKNLPEFYTIFLSRLKDNEAKQLDYLIRSNLDVANPKQVNQDNLLLFDKIKFLISIPYLSNLSITEIINSHPYFKTKVLKAGEHKVSLLEEFNLGFWLIETGKVLFSKNGIDFYDYKKRDIIKVSDHESPSNNVFFYLKEDVRFLIVEEIILMNIIKDYNNIMQKYIDILPDKNHKKIIKELNKNAD